MAKQVHVFHINIGIGDSAIYLLVAPGGQIDKAVLIDAGYPSYSKYVLETMARIAASTSGYTLPAGATSLQFDAVVVTHWDRDHWQGVSQLLNDDISEQSRKPSPQPPRDPVEVFGKRGPPSL
jgi:glyoxylase-like metal-dependent hydrolase (beta-lactamase superfamily II)